MRIAIVAAPYIPIPPKQYGGIEQVIHYLIEGLQESGHEPVLLAPGDSEVNCELIPITPKALFFPLHKKDIMAHQKLVKRAERRTERLLKELLPTIDIIHSHGFDLSKFKDFPNLTTIHNKVDFKSVGPYVRGLDYYMQRTELNYASISKNQQAVFPFLKFVDAVYNGENTDDFPIVTEPEDYLCFLGRMDRDKSPHLAIELALSLNMKIKLAGKIDHDGEEYFAEEIKPHLKSPLVEYLGELGFDEKVELISKAKANLHPTGFREPFGLTVVEAAYCGTPTMAISRGSMPELIEQGRTGILVEDFLEGSSHVEELFNMNREYVASRARQLFNHIAMAEQYVHAYQKVITEMPTPKITPKHSLLDLWDKVQNRFNS